MEKCECYIHSLKQGRYFVDDVYGVIRNAPDRDSR